VGGGGPALRAAPAAPPTGVGACSVSVFQLEQLGQRPNHRGLSYAQVEQT